MTLKELLTGRISFPKKRVICSGIITALLLLLVATRFSQYQAMSANWGILLYIISFLAVLLLGFLIAVRVQWPEKVLQIGATVLFFLIPVVSITMVEALNNKFVYDLSVSAFLFNWVFYLLFYGAFYAASGSYRLSVILFNVIIYPFALANELLYSFRGTVFVPSDFSGIATANNVISTYEFHITGPITISLILLVFLMVVGSRMPTPAKLQRNVLRKIIGRTVSGALFTIILLVYFFTDFFASRGIAPDFWNQNRGYHNTGFFPNFMLNTKYLYYSKPAGYSADAVKQIVQNGAEQPQSFTQNNVQPNIICIMNESFSDLSVLGDFETNIDYMPFFRSLTTNTIRGNLYVPVNGAGTSNTEYEFLTGCSTSFFPSGSNAYMGYIKNPLPSLVSLLQNAGYSDRAIHPYYSSGWNRKTVYEEYFGFSQFRSLGAFMPVSIQEGYRNSGFDPEYLNQLMEEQFPNQNTMVRQYISDSYNYRAIISNYKQSDFNKPYFVFNVTMQNHGGYTTKCSNFTEEVYVTSTARTYEKTNSYLSLMKKSDDALKELISYFSEVEEPTIICLFGDHQPSIETEFIEEIMGKSLDSLTIEEQQKRYITPFIIWANYDIESTYIDKISVNYLSTLLSNVAGLPLSDYQKYLYGLYRQLPVINSVGYIDKNGNYYKQGQSSSYDTLLSNYEKVQYNLAFDQENRKNMLYNYTPPAEDLTE